MKGERIFKEKIVTVTSELIRMIGLRLYDKTMVEVRMKGCLG